MGFPVQPLSLMPLPNSLEGKGFSVSALQQALTLQPSLASKAAGQVMGGNSPAAVMSIISNPSPLNPLKGDKTHTDDQLKEVSKNFESIFMRMLFKEMRNSVQKSEIMGNSRALEFFETMRDEQLSESMAASGGIGIGKMIYERLKETTLTHQKTIK